MILDTGRDNLRLKDRLERLVREKRISHAYIFEGPSDIDKEAFARGFIKGVLCPKGLGENCGQCSICSKIDHGNHEDITYFRKDGLSIKDASVLALQEKIKVKPVGDRNVMVISDCDTLTAKAQNSLLKTLEEPPGDALIILLSENMENLAPTILSRCVKFRIDAQTESLEDEKAGKMIEMSISGCRFHELVHEAGDYLRDRTKAWMLLDSMERVYRDMAIDGSDARRYRFEDICRYVNSIEEARIRLKQKMSAEYAMKELLLEMTE
ncbi:MAG: hypothetical protein IJJ01_01590 [Firmicutes bacterium]|nr:hypothetical protein [Bacillota bacterium]